MSDNLAYFGRSLYAARSVQTDDLDIYIVNPTQIDATGSHKLDKVQGILLQRSQIKDLIVFGPPVEASKIATSSRLRSVSIRSLRWLLILFAAVGAFELFEAVTRR